MVPAEDVETGRLVFRDDDAFSGEREKVLKYGWAFIGIALILFILNLLRIYWWGADFLWVTMLIVWAILATVWYRSIMSWRELEHGIGIHENGFDIFRVSLLAERAFVPFDEIEDWSRGRLAYILHTCRGKKRWRMPYDMLGVRGTLIADEVLTSIEGRNEGGKGPESLDPPEGTHPEDRP